MKKKKNMHESFQVWNLKLTFCLFSSKELLHGQNFKFWNFLHLLQCTILDILFDSLKFNYSIHSTKKYMQVITITKNRTKVDDTDLLQTAG